MDRRLPIPRGMDLCRANRGVLGIDWITHVGYVVNNGGYNEAMGSVTY